MSQPDASSLNYANTRTLAKVSTGNRELQRTAAGDHEAFRQLYAMFDVRVRGYARSLIRDGAFADDVTQEVFMEIWEKAARFDPTKGTATNWIMMLVRSRAIDRIRSIESSRIREEDWQRRHMLRDVDTVTESVRLNLEHEQVKTALVKLTDLQYQTIVLRFFRGLSTAQIGRQLGTSPSTIKSRCRDALRALRAELAMSA